MEIARVCEQNLREEVAMAEWLQKNLPSTTEQFLSRTEMDDDTAKR
jgi:ferritin-like metal-binding protein YciE